MKLTILQFHFKTKLIETQIYSWYSGISECVILHHSSQKCKFDMDWYHEAACVTVWPGAAGPFLLTLASLGKEWPSFLWTRHCVRSPGSGSPFHFMVHRPLCDYAMLSGAEEEMFCDTDVPVSAVWLSLLLSSTSTHWLVNYYSHVKSSPAPLSSSLVLAANEELHMLQRRCSPGLICIGWMEIKLFNVKAKLVNSGSINTLNTHACTPSTT